MIIKYPTGLYKSRFAWLTQVSDTMVHNITWYISSAEPPRLIDRFAQVTKTEDHESLPPKEHTYPQRRRDAGGLAFTIREASNTDTGSVAKQFEEGQVLESQDLASIEQIDIASSNIMEVRHDNNSLDLDKLEPIGIDPESIVSKSEVAIRQYSEQLNVTRSSVMDLELQITEIQKQINELEKIKNAVHLVEPGSEAAIDSAIAGLQSTLNIKAGEHDAKAAEVEDLKDKIRSVSQLVR